MPTTLPGSKQISKCLNLRFDLSRPLFCEQDDALFDIINTQILGQPPKLPRSVPLSNLAHKPNRPRADTAPEAVRPTIYSALRRNNTIAGQTTACQTRFTKPLPALPSSVQQPGRLVTSNIPAAQVIELLNELESLEQEVNQSVARIKESIKEVRDCIRISQAKMNAAKHERERRRQAIENDPGTKMIGMSATEVEVATKPAHQRKGSLDEEGLKRLEKKLQERPEKGELRDRNILKDDRVAPALQAAKEQLERSQLEDKLGHALQHRPKPEELVKEGILPPEAAPTA